ncbi:protein of unknown function (plasmid) [Cupriavidus taiwanensis]|uniref:Uncharacterized protein n=1 Tax=Cupriavidus taiwanensis TaxID=164546 RepID=A0A375EBC0_9BURK|nr:hypothetical protein [Cupriavidus taiwanensis]SOZ70919.1 protein of unknown function [Cupriavidus taiwanensis]SOZ72119.1 protein of unknown function [Cupriavidus taiwanensis]SOZ74413.1 protein of unknown function [Cupriavidus taiwanensis]SPA03319.1 protein of unknown function [Cupriavidus taiwanensis]SPA11294.1 protein of unknown function [Cupriavidus taiwanensis]
MSIHRELEPVLAEQVSEAFKFQVSRAEWVRRMDVTGFPNSKMAESTWIGELFSSDVLIHGGLALTKARDVLVVDAGTPRLPHSSASSAGPYRTTLLSKTVRNRRSLAFAYSQSTKANVAAKDSLRVSGARHQALAQNFLRKEIL